MAAHVYLDDMHVVLSAVLLYVWATEECDESYVPERLGEVKSQAGRRLMMRYSLFLPGQSFLPS